MPIIRMTDAGATNLPSGAYCPLPHIWQAKIALYETHHGLCISEHERNGYDDSDFYMTVWNPEKGEPEHIEFASTRGWSYPCYGSFADATPEVRAEYDTYIKRVRRHCRAVDLVAKRAEATTVSGAIGCPRKRVEALRHQSGQAWPRVKTLLMSKLRSAFRKSLKAQIVAWCRDTAPKYPSPLSPRQWDYI